MSKDIRLRFGKQLRALRQENSLTQEELARRSGISSKYVQNLEGKTPNSVTILILEKLAKGFGISMDELMNI